MSVDGVEYGPFEEAAFSLLLDPQGCFPGASDPRSVRYVAKFRKGEMPDGAVLTDTPVLDDVTILVDHGGPEVLAWVPLNGGVAW